MADLIISQGDCCFAAQCECGYALGLQRPDESFDVFALQWEAHVMTTCPIGPYDPEAQA